MGRAGSCSQFAEPLWKEQPVLAGATERTCFCRRTFFSMANLLGLSTSSGWTASHSRPDSQRAQKAIAHDCFRHHRSADLLGGKDKHPPKQLSKETTLDSAILTNVHVSSKHSVLLTIERRHVLLLLVALVVGFDGCGESECSARSPICLSGT